MLVFKKEPLPWPSVSITDDATASKPCDRHTLGRVTTRIGVLAPIPRIDQPGPRRIGPLTTPMH